MAKQKTTAGGSSSIITIDPYSNTSYKFGASEMVENDLDKSSFKKSNFFVSYVMAKDIVYGTIELSRSVPETDLQDALQIKAYEDLGLDASVNYKINYLETVASASDQKNYIYDVFAINADSMAQSFGKIRKKVPFVDYVTTAPLLIEALYKKGVVDVHGGTECFVYFQKNDAFLAIYQNGKYLYSKSLRYSLREINERFCALAGERVDEDTFFDVLKREGLNTSDVKYQQYFMKLFGEIFLYVNDISVYGKRYCNIAHIDRVYVGTEIGIVAGMNEYVKSYMGLDAHNFNFNISINSNEYIDQVHVMMALAAQVYRDSGNENTLNLTVFKRPDPLSKRPVGTLLLAIAAGFIVSIAYPLYNYGIGTYKMIVHDIKNNEYQNSVLPEANGIRAEIKSLQQELQQLNEKLNTELAILEVRSNLLKEIRNKRVDYKMRAAVIADLVKMTNGNSVQLSKIEQNGENMVFSLVSSDEKRITELMDEIANTGNYTIRAKTISINNATKKYESNISMEIL